MPIKNMSLEEFLEFLKQKQGDQTTTSFASSLGVSPQYLCDVYNGRRTPSDTITSALNAQRNTVYSVDTATTEEEKDNEG